MSLRYGEVWQNDRGDLLMALGVREDGRFNMGQVEAMSLLKRVSYSPRDDMVRRIDAIVFDEGGLEWTRIDK